MNKLSILNIILNEEELLPKYLEFITRMNPYDVVFVDGGSEDKSIEIISKHAEKHPDIKWKLIQKKMNKDFSIQRNVGLDQCEGDWVFALDTDETLSETWFWYSDWYMKQSDVLAYALARIHLFPDEKSFLHKSYPDTQIRFFRNNKNIRFVGEVHEIPYYQNVPLFQTGKCFFSKNVTMIHWALLKSEKALLDKGTRWEDFAQVSKERGFDIGENNPRRFCFKDRIGTKDEVPTDLLINHRYIML